MKQRLAVDIVCTAEADADKKAGDAPESLHISRAASPWPRRPAPACCCTAVWLCAARTARAPRLSSSCFDCRSAAPQQAPWRCRRASHPARLAIGPPTMPPTRPRIADSTDGAQPVGLRFLEWWRAPSRICLPWSFKSSKAPPLVASAGSRRAGGGSDRLEEGWTGASRDRRCDLVGCSGGRGASRAAVRSGQACAIHERGAGFGRSRDAFVPRALLLFPRGRCGRQMKPAAGAFDKLASTV